MCLGLQLLELLEEGPLVLRLDVIGVVGLDRGHEIGCWSLENWVIHLRFRCSGCSIHRIHSAILIQWAQWVNCISIALAEASISHSLIVIEIRFSCDDLVRGIIVFRSSFVGGGIAWEDLGKDLSASLALLGWAVRLAGLILLLLLMFVLFLRWLELVVVHAKLLGISDRIVSLRSNHVFLSLMRMQISSVSRRVCLWGSIGLRLSVIWSINSLAAASVIFLEMLLWVAWLLRLGSWLTLIVLWSILFLGRHFLGEAVFSKLNLFIIHRILSICVESWAVGWLSFIILFIFFLDSWDAWIARVYMSNLFSMVWSVNRGLISTHLFAASSVFFDIATLILIVVIIIFLVKLVGVKLHRLLLEIFSLVFNAQFTVPLLFFRLN